MGPLTRELAIQIPSSRDQSESLEDLKHLGRTSGEAREGLLIWPSEVHDARGRLRSKGEDAPGGVSDGMGIECQGYKDEDCFTWQLSLLTHDVQLPLQWCHFLPLFGGLVRGNHQGQSVSIACDIHYRSARRPRSTVVLWKGLVVEG